MVGPPMERSKDGEFLCCQFFLRQADFGSQDVDFIMNMSIL